MSAIASCATATSSVHQQLGAEPPEGAAQQTRDVHLRAADAGGDVVLVELVEEAEDHDLALRLGQAVDQPGQQEQVLQLLAGRAAGSRSPSELSPSSPTCWSSETSERVWTTSIASSASSSGDAQVRGQLGDGGRAPQGVRQLVEGLAQAQERSFTGRETWTRQLVSRR